MDYLCCQCTETVPDHVATINRDDEHSLHPAEDLKTAQTEGAASADVPQVVPKAPASSTVTVFIASAKGLRAADWLSSGNKSDPYVIVGIQGKGKEVQALTSTIPNTLEPDWEEELQISWTKGENLELQVMDKDTAKFDDKLGRFVLPSALFEANGFLGEVELENVGAGRKAYLRIKVKLPGQNYPEGAGAEFKAVIEKKGQEPLGIALDVFEKVNCMITKVKDDGLVAAYNKTAPPELQIRPGYYLVQCNKITDPVETVAALRSPGKLDLVVRRAHEFKVRPTKIKDALGAAFHHIENGSTILMHDISADGAIAKWNQDNKNKLIKVNDRVVAVNGQRGNAAELLDLTAKAGTLELTMSRPAEATASGFFI